MTARLKSFQSLPDKCAHALFAAYWANNWRCLDGELIIFHIDKALLIRARTHKCARADLPASALPRKRPSATAAQHVVMGQQRT